MRIFSIVTLVSPDGEYGGPVRVAVNHARALREAGHDARVVGGARGFGPVMPTEIDGVPVHLFRARTVIPGIGFAGLASPALQRWLHRHGSSADILHIHAARDFVTLPAADWARRHRVPYVLQTHGMIDVSSNPLARPLDAAITRRVLTHAKVVFYLTDRERSDLILVAGRDIPLAELGNGVPTSTLERHHLRDPAEVLYLARLAPRKRPLAFVQAAAILAASYPNAEFSLVGPDEGEGAAISEAIAGIGTDAIRWEGALPPEKTTGRMSQSSIYVLPSVDEPYPMSVLEAMSVGLPVIVTETCGLAPAIREIGCGIVVDATLESLTTAIGELLGDPALARRMGEAGLTASRERFGMAAVAERLEASYRS
ncbi:glycosyltransferase [Frigoribacterium sp. UYMn621]|uniref:glycosyltransferase n=1 Tax=Frigoribacterium sp. UYMn621 TaxID=3156343 RepID=UPI0033924248